MQYKPNAVSLLLVRYSLTLCRAVENAKNCEMKKDVVQINLNIINMHVNYIFKGKYSGRKKKAEIL